MADGLNAIAGLARDESFRQRVKAAMAVTARDVGSEAGAIHVTYHELRRSAAKYMMLDIDDEMLTAFCWLTASNPVITRSSSDDDIQFTVNAVFPTIAECGPPEGS